MNSEQRIRELAYQIWESEGRPEGEDARHWQMAIKLLDSEQKGDLQPAPEKKPAARKPRAKAAPPDDETQMEKPALLGKPAGAGKARASRSTASKPAKARQPVTRTTKVSEPGNPTDSSTE